MADKIIIEVGLEDGDYSNRAKEIIKQMQEIKDKQTILAATGKKNTLEWEQNKIALVNLGRELKANTLLSQNYEDSIQGMRSKLSLLTAQWVSLSKEQRENTEEGKALAAQMLELTDALKEQEKGVGNTTRNVGNYKDSLKEALTEMIPFGGQIGDMVGKGAALGQSVIVAAKSMGTFKMALASTGIGLIIPLVAALITYLSKFDPIIDRVEQALAGLGAWLNKLALTVVNFVQNLKSMGDFLNKIGDIMKDPVGSFNNLRDSMEEAARAAMDLKKAQQDLEDQQKIQEVLNAKAQQQVEQLMLQARNRALSEKERIKLLQEASRIDQENFNQRTKIVNEELSQAQRAIAIKAGLSKQEMERLKREGLAYAFELKDRAAVTDEEIDALQAAEISKSNILKESTNRQEKIQNLADANAERAAAKAEKLAKAREERRKKEEEADKERIASLVRTNETLLTARQKELDGINAEINEKVAMYKKYGRTTEQLEKERIARLQQLRDEHLKADLAAIEENNQQILDMQVAAIQDEEQRKLAEVELNNSRRLAQQDKVIQDLRDREAKGEKGLTGLIESELSVRSAIVEDNARLKNETLAELDDERLKKLQEHQLLMAQLEIENAGTPAEKIQALQDQLTLEYDIRIANAIKLGEDTTAIHAEFRARQRELDDAGNQAAIDGINAFGNAFQETLGKNTKAAKLAADIQARINAATALQNNILIIQENMRAISAQGKLLFPANIVAITSTIAAITSAVSNARKMISLPKFAGGGVFESDGKGAVLPGYSRTDNTNAKLRSGEAVIVAEAARDPKTLNLLSAINTRFGGRPLVGPGSPGYYSSMPAFADGGIYGQTAANIAGGIVNPNDIALAIGEQFSKLTIVTDVRDVISAQAKREAAGNNGVV